MGDRDGYGGTVVLTIINADDLGASEAVNDRIFELMAEGLVTSATIMANGPAFEHAVRQLVRFPQCSFGVHLNLTVFRPLTHAKAMAQVLGSDGTLSTRLYGSLLSGDLLAALKAELFAQVQRSFDAGVPVSHLDSHHHIHTIPRLFFVIKALQRHFGIRRVRSTINVLPSGQRLTPVMTVKKKLFCMALRSIWTTRSPDGLCDFLDFYNNLEVGDCPRFRSMELMVHPGANSERYVKEVELLRSGNWQRLLPGYAEMGSYHWL